MLLFLNKSQIEVSPKTVVIPEASCKGLLKAKWKIKTNNIQKTVTESGFSDNKESLKAKEKKYPIRKTTNIVPVNVKSEAIHV